MIVLNSLNRNLSIQILSKCVFLDYVSDCILVLSCLLPINAFTQQIFLLCQRCDPFRNGITCYNYFKVNIAYPANGTQKCLEIDDDHKLRPFYEKRMATEMPVDFLGDEWKGYIVKITGGNDKQGFPMKQGVLTNGRVRLLLSKGKCYNPRRKGTRKRKSVRGCIVDSNLSALNLVVMRKGDNQIPGLTDVSVPRRLGPKRASKIRRLFNLEKLDDVRQYVVRKPLPEKNGMRKY